MTRTGWSGVGGPIGRGMHRLQAGERTTKSLRVCFRCVRESDGTVNVCIRNGYEMKDKNETTKTCGWCFLPSFFSFFYIGHATNFKAKKEEKTLAIEFLAGTGISATFPSLRQNFYA